MRVFDPQRGAGLTRVERAASQRRQRARAHLDKMQRRQQVRRAARVRPLAAAILLVSLVSGAWAGASWRREARLDALSVRGLRHVRPVEIAAAGGLEPGAAIAGRDAGTLAERVAGHAWIERARALALPGGRVLLAVVEREPAAVLAGDTAWAVDEAGMPFAPVGAAELPQLPRLHAPDPAPGEPHADLAAAVALAQRLPALGLPRPTEVGIAADPDEGFSLRLAGLRPRIVLGRDDLDARLADLATLLERARPELERAERVDLRFRDQAVLDVSPPQEGAAQAAATRGGVAPSNRQPAG